MQCYTELIPPSAITHAVSLPFLDANANNLIVAKTSLLQIFRLSNDNSHAANNNIASDISTTSKFILVAEYALSGTITSLAPINTLSTTRKSTGSALLISFEDAKLSLIEWDPNNHTISTISIHFYEGENVHLEPFGPSLSESQSILTVDPSSRCAALKFGVRSLAILPFRQAGDELVEDGFDAEDGEEMKGLKRTVSNANDAAGGELKQTPYKASFVLPLTALDPMLSHVVHLAFLHEYRQPTFGILSASCSPSSALLEERRDVISYTVFTLDLEQRASTNLISVQKLPSDLWKVVPLPLPVGGALLVGTNEFVHVDQSGKTNAVAVNEFARVASGFSMVDQSGLAMKLEGCEIEFLDERTGDLLVVLGDGSMAILSFRLLGRNVGGFTVTSVSADDGGALVEAAPSCTASLDDNQLFIGSEIGDSTLLTWTKPTSRLSRKRSHAQMLGTEAGVAEEDNDEDVDEDDLYAPTAEAAKRAESFSGPTQADVASSYAFVRQDTVPSLAPINNVCFGRSPSMPDGKLEMLAAVGRGKGNRLAFISKEIIPSELRSTSFSQAKDAWSLRTRSSEEENEAHYDDLLLVYDGDSTQVYDIDAPTNEANEEIYTERTSTEFEREGETLTVSTLAHSTRIVQCRRNEIRTYDAADLALSQIIPMLDEETDAELKIVHTSFCDPYLLVLRDDSSVLVLKADEGGDIEPLDTEGADEERKWLSGCLYAGDFFAGETVALLLGEEGGLHFFSLPDFKQIFTAPALSHLPAVLTSEAPPRRWGSAKEMLTEVLFAELGDEDDKQAYLVLRSALEDLTVYEPFRNGGDSLQDSLRFRKIPFNYIPKFGESTAEDDDARPAPLRSILVGRRHIVHVPGEEPVFIVKETSSHPKALTVRTKNVRSLTPLNRRGCQHGFGLIDFDSKFHECQIPNYLDLSSGWSIQRIAFGDPIQEVRHIAFHEERHMYVVATCSDVDFHYPEDEGKHHEQYDISLHPQIPQYTIHLISARTRNIIHSYEVPYLETVTSLKVMPLEVSEQTHEQKPMIVVGTALQRGEDMPAKGAVTVFEILEVVPEPGRLESEWQLHVIAREETRGAITAVESFSAGLIGTAQGQKILIRGLKEDGSCLPVALLDAQCHTTQLKMLGRSGMFLAGDAWKGLWFGGFTEEPYKLTVLGKSRTKMEIVATEFLPFDGQMFILIMDARMDLHVLQYDPENPKSLSGTRLLHRSTIHVGHFASGLTLLPSTLVPMGDQKMTNGDNDAGQEPAALSHVLTTSMTGSIGLITPVDEITYRRLGSIQTHLTSVLEHAAGLNPRAYRAVESEGFGSRGIIDGSLVQRINELGSSRRAEVLGRAGADAWALRSDLEVIGGGGLGYL